jgi:hypothetical protein
MSRIAVGWIIAGFLLGGACGTNNQGGASTPRDAAVLQDGNSPEIHESDGEMADASVADSRAPSFDPVACPNKPPTQTISCGGQVCPPPNKDQDNPCFIPCCLQFEGQERCGLAGIAPGFTTGCTLPAMLDPSCYEVPQFEPCCDPVQHKCGIVGGFAPGCQITSRFVTLPKDPKSCGLDGGAGIEGGAGADGGASSDGGAATD